MSRETDPVVSYNFSVVIDGGVNATGYFTEVSGITSEHGLVEHKVVSPDGKEFIQMLPGRIKWEPVTLKKGVTTDMGFWQWREMVVNGDLEGARANMTITMYDRNYNPIVTWNFRSAWPSKVAGPSINAGSDDFSVEEIVVAHEGMERDGSTGFPV